ncbi:MAG: YheT family hydrolase [bacterium]
MKSINKTIEPFRPAWWANGGHLQTILSYYLYRPQNLLFDEAHKIELDDGDTIVMLENRPQSAPQGAILLMHGLGSDADAPYIRRFVPSFLERNWTVLRINHRGAGAGEGLAKNLYHSGRSEDVSAALMRAAALYPGLPLVAAGFSLSGNMLLKLLGEQAQPIPANMRTAFAVNPPIDLSLCARALRQKSNLIYDIRFVRLLKKTMRQRMIDFPDFPRVPLEKINSLYDFDEQITAPLNGFSSAEDYYAQCHAKQFLDGISMPALIIASDDDPFIPRETFDNLPGSKYVKLLLTRSGGHVGFVNAHKTALGNRRWLEYAIIKHSCG